MGKLEETVLSYPKLKERLENGEKGDKSKVLKNLAEIKAEYSQAYIRSFEKLLDTALPQVYDGINFNPHDLDIPELVKNNCVVMVPNHQSHADYVAINYMFFKNYHFPLYVAGGNNLNIFPLGRLFRKSGCFFIRRSFHNDILYKLTLEAYLHYLLLEKKPIEFFFEGGRSRTGKLRPPRFGLYQMLLEAHRALPEEKKADLLFIPVSINHEYVPEQRSLVRESKGSKKMKESTTQLLRLLGIFAQQYGNIHINLGNPIKGLAPEEHAKLKKRTQELAFECFVEVGRNMVVTPTALLSTILLDEPGGALKWEEIISKCEAVLSYCEQFDVPVTPSLSHERREESFKRALDILIGNGKIEIIGKAKKGPVLYAINEDSRSELLYFKNSILHHFLIPWGITAAWISLFSGEIETVRDLQRFFLERRSQLKHEFYLPTTKDYLEQTLDVISKIIGRKVGTLAECLELSHKDLYLIAARLGVFARAMNPIFEAYYVSATTMIRLLEEDSEGFKRESYEKTYKDVFEKERKVGRVIKYTESYSTPMVRSSFEYFSHAGYIHLDNGVYKAQDPKALERAAEYFERILRRTFSFNLGPLTPQDLNAPEEQEKSEEEKG